jgi:ketosteroid isomerase-like protein
MSQANVEVVRRLYDAVARRDAATVLSLYDPDVELDNSRFHAVGFGGPGVYRGHEGLRRFFREWHDAWEEVEYDYDELIDAGDRVISVDIGRGRGRASGIEVEASQCGVWTIREGKVVRVEWFPSRAEALKAAGIED